MDLSSLEDIRPFYVMEILEKALKLQSLGRDIVHLEIGEPTENVDNLIINSAQNALNNNLDKYTNSFGIESLREKISQYYEKVHHTLVPTDRIMITTGSSAGIILAILASTSINDEVIVVEPHYPCYPQILKILGRKPKIFSTFEEDNFQINVDKLRGTISQSTTAIIINSPSNPTSVSQNPDVLESVVRMNLNIISDEIYHGLSFGSNIKSIIEFESKNTFIVNGFSKLYAMTGWRLGYIVIPSDKVRSVQKLQQNMFICAPTISQYAAVSAYEIKSEVQKNILKSYEQKRDFVLRFLDEIGIKVNYVPDAAFYILCNFEDYCESSLDLCKDLLDKVGLAIAPGIDFGENYKKYVRISYAGSMEELQKGLMLLKEYILKYK
mgnify:FL=1